MKIVNESVEIVDKINGVQILKNIEKAGRTCYKSEHIISNDSYIKFIKNILKRGHESVLEHEKITVRVICDRGVTHEIVRHRIASYSQESTRYCNYSNDKFNSEISFVKPSCIDANSDAFKVWKKACEICETQYFALLNWGCSAQEARSVLPNSLKTEIVITMNLREWRHFFKMRCASDAHPDMRKVANMILTEFKKNIPIIFDEY